jgi:hypothetical protein
MRELFEDCVAVALADGFAAELAIEQRANRDDS